MGSVTVPPTDEGSGEVDYCKEFACGFTCRTPCGWDNDIGMCVTGGTTTTEEEAAGECNGVGEETDAPEEVTDGEGEFVNVESQDQSASSGGLLNDFDPKLVIIIAVGVAIMFLISLAFCYCKQYNEVKKEAAQAYSIPGPMDYMMQPQSANTSWQSGSVQLSMHASPGAVSTRV